MSTFSLQQKIDIVELWGEVKDLRKVRGAYAKKHNLHRHPRLLPSIKRFKVVVDNFLKTK